MNFTLLKRFPDFEAPNLHAYDASDKLILELADPLLKGASDGTVTIIGDRYGALLLGVAGGRDATGGQGVRGVRMYQDELLQELAVKENAKNIGLSQSYTSHDLGPELLRDSELVLLQLPRSLSALREISDAIARWAKPDVTVISAGRIKHMTLGMNSVLREYFKSVVPGLARQKSRPIVARGALEVAGNPPFPIWGEDPDLGFALSSFGATFGGSKLDHGTRLLMKTIKQKLSDRKSENLTLADIGSGNGAIAVWAASLSESFSIVASDQARSAVKATAVTAKDAGVSDRVSVIRTNGLREAPPDNIDIALINPPFHSGSALNENLFEQILGSSLHALKTGAEVWVVCNSHLNYLPIMRSLIGESSQVARDQRFKVLHGSFTR